MYTLNYHHLKYFWAIARLGSLTKASEELNLTPQTVSSQIRDLEEGLGKKLFERSGRRLVLTDTGHMVNQYAEEIFSTGKELMDVIRGLPSKTRSVFQLGLPMCCQSSLRTACLDPPSA